MNNAAARKQTPPVEPPDHTRVSVLRQLAVLPSLSMDQLRAKWSDLYGSKPPEYKRGFLIKRLAYRIQELFYGGLPEPVKAKLNRVAENDPVATVQRRMQSSKKDEGAIVPGTRFVRVWKERRYEVTVHPEGFEMNGRMFNSLSAAAFAVTGKKWNGRVFFGLKKWDGKTEGFKNA